MKLTHVVLLVALLIPALVFAEPAPPPSPAAAFHVELTADSDTEAVIAVLDGRLRALDASGLLPIRSSSVVASGELGIVVDVEVAWRPCAGRAMGCIAQGLVGSLLHPSAPPAVAQRCSEAKLVGWTQVLDRVLTRPGEIELFRALEEPARSLTQALRSAPDLADAQVRAEYKGLVVVEGGTLPAIRAAASSWASGRSLRVLTEPPMGGAPDGHRDGPESVGLRVVEKDPAMVIRRVDEAEVSQDGGDFAHPALRIRFTAQDGRRFGELTGSMVEQVLAIVMDGQLQSAPVVRERIDGGSASLITCGAQTSYSDCLSQARELAAVLRGGALPAPVRHVATDGTCAE